jgi:hypothetical protein
MNSSRIALALVFAASAVYAAAPDVEIQASAKMVDTSQAQNAGRRNASKEQWQYVLMIENKRFQPLLNIEVRYMTFYSQVHLGSKDAPQQQHESGSFTIDALQPHEKKPFTTTPVELKKSHLVGHYHYVNGGRIKAEDALVGIWVRVYQGGQIVGEYANPTTLMHEQCNDFAARA